MVLCAGQCVDITTDPANCGFCGHYGCPIEAKGDPVAPLRNALRTGRCEIRPESIVERVLRELPTGQPQSAPPITFTVSSAGDYKIEIKQLYGKQKGDAVLRVVE